MNGITMKGKTGARTCLFLVLVIACCLACLCPQVSGTAFGETAGTVKIAGSKSPWKAYRLVAGEVSDGRLAGCSTTGLMNDGFWKGIGAEGGGQEAAEKLAAIAAGDSSGAATARLGRLALSSKAPFVEVTEEDAEKGFQLPSGYWLLVSDLSQPMLVPVGSAGLEATAKSAGPTVRKQVKDAPGRWREAGEASQGQKVSYRIVSTMPSNAAAYEKLPYKIVDELPAGMWVDAGGIRVMARDESGNERDVTASCEVGCSDGKLVVDVGKGDALPLLSSDPGKASVIVLYDAKLTEKSAVGAEKGNPNLAHVEYPGSPTSGGTVSTEKARAQLFTWKIRLVKTGSDEPLSGAVFELRTAEGGLVGKSTTDGDGLAGFPSVASGTYQLVETEAPEGFERASDTTVTIRADLGARGAKTRISAHAEGSGRLKSVSVPKGTVTVAVDDAPGSEGPSEGRDSDSEGISENPKTGDTGRLPLAALGIAATAAVLLVACAAARRRRRI